LSMALGNGMNSFKTLIACISKKKGSFKNSWNFVEMGALQQDNQ
jgi:hypothetical protein